MVDREMSFVNGWGLYFVFRLFWLDRITLSTTISGTLSTLLTPQRSRLMCPEDLRVILGRRI